MSTAPDYGAMPSLTTTTHTILASSAVAPNPNPHDPTSLPLAFGDRQMPKLRLSLSSPLLPVRQRALISLSSLLLNPDCIASALHADTVSGLCVCLDDDDELVRATSGKCLAAISSLAAGKVALAVGNTLPLLGQVANDDKKSVRSAALAALAAQADDYDGAHSVLIAGLVPVLVDKAAVEEEGLQVLALDALIGVVRVDAGEALRVGAMDVGIALLGHEAGRVRLRAAQLIAALATPFEGKILAVEAGGVAPLVAALGDDELSVQPEAARALMAITVYNGGKVAALEAGGPSMLSDIVVADPGDSIDEEEEGEVAAAKERGERVIPVRQEEHVRQLRICALKAITNIAEHPLGRRAFLPLVDRIAEIAQAGEADNDALMARSCEIALRVIQFTP